MAMNPAMLEATRLTRAGRLAEATALIQRLLARVEAGTGSVPAKQGMPPLIDQEPAGSQPRGDALPPFNGTTTHGTKGGSMLRGALGALVERAVSGAGRRGQSADPSPSPAADPLPDGAAFVTGSYSNAAGTRSYKLYVPSGRADQRLPLMVMLHGCTQSPDDFAAGTRMNSLAEEQGFLVAYPAQPASANNAKCWNWFSPEHQQRGQGEASLIAGITRQVMRDYRVDPNRVYIAGLSAGGAAAAIMGAAYPDLYAAVGVHSGLACGAARDLPSAFTAMRQGGIPAEVPGDGARQVPTIVFHGDQDNTVHPRNGDQVVAQAGQSGATLRATVARGQVPGGRAYSRTVHTDPSGRVLCEQWTIHGAGHAWAGGSPAGSYTDPQGPDATREMMRFFLRQMG